MKKEFTADVTLTDISFDTIVRLLKRELVDIRTQYENAIDAGENPTPYRVRRDYILAALREMGVE